MYLVIIVGGLYQCNLILVMINLLGLRLIMYLGLLEYIRRRSSIYLTAYPTPKSE